MKKFLTTLAACGLATVSAFSFSACSPMSNGYGDYGWSGSYAPGNSADSESSDSATGGENFVHGQVIEQDFTATAEKSSSYFSLNRNTASYSQIRYQIENGWTISPDSVRVEELINYFNYDFDAPEEKAVAVSAYLGDCPWENTHKLMLAGIKTDEMKLDAVNGNYVFLIDVSGSMSGDDRLGLAKKGLNKLVDGLGDGDVVSIVTYASGVKTVLDGGECSESGKADVKSKISGLKAGGSTFGSAGLQRAYEIAEKHYITGGNNRVIIITDGDFNVGISNKDDMMEYISARTVAEKSVYLSVLGVGMGNMRDDMLETLSRHGNGNYAYLDNEMEAEKVLCHELNGTLMTVAKDAKAGVKFNEENVVKYRLIGYDTLIISREEFEDETTDTGEIGSNLCVAALYEIELAEDAEGDLAEIEVRYKDVRGEAEFSDSVTAEVTTATASSPDFKFVTCVAEFGLVIRQSKYALNADLYSVLERLEIISDYLSADPYRLSFKTLVGQASEKYGFVAE